MPTENSKVLVVLSRTAAKEALSRERVRDMENSVLSKALRGALDAEQEERREYRIVWSNGAIGYRYEEDQLGIARQHLARQHSSESEITGHIQVRTITQLPEGQFISGWRDLGEGE